MAQAPAGNLDARLLRFRNRPEAEDGRALARDLLRAGRGAEATEVAERALRRAPDDPELLVLDGRGLLLEGELLRAQAQLLAAVRVASHRAEPLRWLGEVLLRRGDAARARKVLERARALDPSDPEVAELFSRASEVAAGEVPSPAAPPAWPSGPKRHSLPDHEDQDEQPTTVASSPLVPPRALQSDPPPPSFTEPGRTRPGFSEGTEELELEDMDELRGTATRVAGPEYKALTDGLEAPTSVMDLGAIARSSAPGAEAPAPEGPRRRPRKPTLPMTGFAPPAAAALPTEVDHRAPFAEPPTAPRAPLPSERPVRPPSGPPAPVPVEPPSPPSLSEEPTAVLAPKAGLFEPAGVAWPSADALPRGPAPGLPGGFGVPERLNTDEELTAAGARRYGATAHDPADQAVSVVRRQGLFESAPSGPSPGWASSREARRTGTRVGWTLLVVWVLGAALAGGGYYGWTQWVAHNERRAASLVESARADAFVGEHRTLADAERKLREARELHPKGKAGPRVLLFVHVQRALEDGSDQLLRPALARAERLGVPERELEVSRAVLAAIEGQMTEAEKHLEALAKDESDDAALLYSIGRIKQRLGHEDAVAYLERAADRDANLVAAAVALSEARADLGHPDDALTLLDRVLARHKGHLRATLWRLFLTADDTPPDKGLEVLDELSPRFREGAPTDRVLAELARARLRRRKGQLDAAADAVERASRAGATEPRLLTLVATSGRALGELGYALEAASRALSAAPNNADVRKLLAEIRIERRDGVGALKTLSVLSAEDPEVLRMSAQAAILVGTKEALEAAREALFAFLAETDEPSVEMRALGIRVRVKLGEGATLLPEARKLAKSAPGDPDAVKAFGDTALAAYDPKAAEEAFMRLVRATPDDGDAYYLLGRAHRMAGHADEAEAAFQSAVELMPEHTDAALALGYLLLDRGKYEEAEALYRGLSQRSGLSGGASTVAMARLGRVEALIGLGRLEDAAAQLEHVREQESAQSCITGARLALASGNPGEAVSRLRPLAEGEPAGPGVIALFADALFEAGEGEAAGEQYERALALDAGYPEALVGKARIFARAEKGAETLSAAEQAAESLAHRIRPPALRAEVDTLLGRAHLMDPRGAEAARDALTQATESGAAPSEAWFYLGEALAKVNAREARAAYRKYLDLDPDGPYARRAKRAL